jgi:hypothetical protein
VIESPISEQTQRRPKVGLIGWGAEQQAAREAEQLADPPAGVLFGHVHDDLPILPAVPRSSLLTF